MRNLLPRNSAVLIAALSFSLFFALADTVVEAGKNDRTRPADKEAIAMDYGPYLANTFEAPGGNLTVKGILIKLDKTHDAGMLFDTELCRWSCGWVGPNVHLASRVFSSDNDFHCTIDNGVQLATPLVPGWQNHGKIEDPRHPADGPLPHEWAHYKGLFLHESQVVLSYTVGTTDVLELPGVTFNDNGAIFTRDIRVAAHKEVLAVLVANVFAENAPAGSLSFTDSTSDNHLDFTDGTTRHIATIVDAPVGRHFSTATLHGLLKYLELPASEKPIVFRIAIQQVDLKAVKPFDGWNPGTAVDPEPLTHGGPARWRETVSTRGELAKETAPYVIDTIPAPDKNPWNSWIRFTGIDFFPDGRRAALCTWSGDVWIASGIDHDLSNISWKRFATGLNNPMGVKIVDGVIHTIDRSQITKLVDLDGDGEADYYQNFNNDCTLTPNFHEMAFDLQTDSQGNFYFSKSSAIWAPPLRLAEHAGAVLKVTKDGSKLERLCYGLRAPNGVSVGPDDKVYCTDNQGNWVPSCPINLIKKDAFYGYSFHDGRPNPPTDRDKPLCWIPYGRDKSSGTLAWDLADQWGPFKNHMIECSYDCSIFEVIQEFVGDQVQGGVVKFPLHFPSGVMRARFNPVDGQLYLAGLRGWSSRAAKDECFQRVRYTGKSVYYPIAVETVHGGMKITFSGNLDPKSVEADNIAAEEFNVVRTASYGSPEFSVKNPKKPGHDVVDIISAKLLPDGRTISLEIPSLTPVTNINLTFKLTAADGTAIDQELDYTLNQVP